MYVECVTAFLSTRCYRGVNYNYGNRDRILGLSQILYRDFLPLCDRVYRSSLPLRLLLFHCVKNVKLKNLVENINHLSKKYFPAMKAVTTKRTKVILDQHR